MLDANCDERGDLIGGLAFTLLVFLFPLYFIIPSIIWIGIYSLSCLIDYYGYLWSKVEYSKQTKLMDFKEEDDRNGTHV